MLLVFIPKHFQNILKSIILIKIYNLKILCVCVWLWFKFKYRIDFSKYFVLRYTCKYITAWFMSESFPDSSAVVSSMDGRNITCSSTFACCSPLLDISFCQGHHSTVHSFIVDRQKQQHDYFLFPHTYDYIYVYNHYPRFIKVHDPLIFVTIIAITRH